MQHTLSATVSGVENVGVPDWQDCLINELLDELHGVMPSPNTSSSISQSISWKNHDDIVLQPPGEENVRYNEIAVVTEESLVEESDDPADISCCYTGGTGPK